MGWVQSRRGRAGGSGGFIVAGTDGHGRAERTLLCKNAGRHPGRGSLTAWKPVRETASDHRAAGVERGRHLVSNRARSGAVLPSTAVRAQRRLKPLQRVRDPRWIRAEHNRRVAAAAPGRHEDIFVRYKYLLYDKAGGAVALTLPTALLAVHLRAARGGRGGVWRGGSAPCMRGAARHARGQRVQGTVANSTDDWPTARKLGRAVLRVPLSCLLRKIINTAGRRRKTGGAGGVGVSGGSPCSRRSRRRRRTARSRSTAAPSRHPSAPGGNPQPPTY